MQTQMIEKLFKRFNDYLDQRGLSAESGMIADASIVEAPKQRNNRDDNKAIKSGKVPESITKNPNRQRQKDIDAHWAIKRGKTTGSD